MNIVNHHHYHQYQMLDGSPLARLPTMPRFIIAKFSLAINIVNHYQSAQVGHCEVFLKINIVIRPHYQCVQW